MLKRKYNVLRFAAVGIAFCLGLFVACKNDTDGNDETGNTNVKLINLEQYKVTVYRDSLRQNVFAEVAALGSAVVSAEPSASGTVFYPTFNLEMFDLPGIGVPYDAPGIVITIADGKTTDVPIPKLETININSAFIKVINNSSYSLSLRQGGEINLLGASSGVINANQSAVYDVTPGLVSGYSLMRNTITPVAFPADITEFKRGLIYVFTYDGTSLPLTETKSVLQAVPPAVPGNIQVEVLSNSSVRLTWSEVTGATSYKVYRATGSSTASYTLIGTPTSAFYDDTALSAGQAYYYKISALSGINRESAQSTAVVAIMPPGDVLRVSAITAGSVSLIWDTFLGASGYNVYRSENEAGTYSKINTAAVSGTEFTDAGVSAYSTYWYKVSAIIEGIESPQSISISASTGSVVPDNGLAAKLLWLKTYVESNSLYIIELNSDENIGPQTLSYSGKSGVTIAMSGVGGMRTVGLSSNGAMFTVSNGVTLVLDNNITLQGLGSNSSSLVRVADGGTLVMNTGSTVTGNTYSSTSSSVAGGGVRVNYGTFTMNGGTISGNTITITATSNVSASGGGVFVSYGTFTMNGGIISNNAAYSRSNSSGAASYGGGVYAGYGTTFTMNGGTISSNFASSTANYSSSAYGGGVYTEESFRMSGGVIYGGIAAEGNSAGRGDVLYRDGGTAQYGTFSGDTFYPSGNLDTTSTTIRVVNGNLLTE
jgi:hypothetical protein